MKSTVLTALLALAILQPARADFDAGLTAFNRGDFETALAEWKTLADQGHARAQFQLGVMHSNGSGVPISLREALKHYEMAAEQGFPDAQNALGFVYRVGNGVSQSYDQSAKWYRLAAEAGVAEAQLNLGIFYGAGKGVPQSFVQAYKWFSLAAAQGLDAARPALFVCMDKLTEDQIAEAERLAAQWRPRTGS